ncbi:methionine--tRNA ligase [Isoptericola sp. b441]|uniref:Methionine--tRNA ligase n=1 Tax=Actinotalea lenta TaxID=3064654 RepID=A0ABT9DC69_9CELL|nr:methionine--tRNA ligase [Isoptericola sp. b441]MDO8106783.1 methionine--tRNA ligase [Isoptericola sp. b441]
MAHILSAVAWPYANGPRHIGHVAGFGVPSDVFSRYMRMVGHEVLMVSGTDEHGTPILVQADKEGVSAKELADKNNAIIVQDLVDLGLSYDLFTRTTTGNHYRTVQELFTTVHRNGYMVERTTQAAISPSTGRTLPDRYIEGTCPICRYAEARGDQCDNCGNQLDPTDLIEPRSKINGETPEFVQTQHFFLDLPALAEALGAWLDEREATGLWRPNVIKFSQNILGDIRPRAMTRDIDWGIPIPLEGWREQRSKRLYVWFDAVIGYLSASIEWARRIGDPDRWREWWNDPESLSYYFMGKDNIVFHSQIWPAELLAYNGEGERGGAPGQYGRLNLPTEVVSSEFMTMESKQLSTSRGHVILVGDMLARYQPDALRYFICAAGPETSDADFTWAEFVQRTNSELVAGWGNLVNRTATMIAKNFGEIPPVGALEPVDETVLATVRAGFDAVGGLIGRHRQRAAIAEAMRVVGEVNKYLTVTEPYKMKDPSQRERLATVLHVAAQCVQDCNTLLAPFLPHSANRVHQVLGGTGELMPMPRIDHVTELDPGDGAGLDRYPVITGDYSATPAWESRPVVPGTPVAKPTPVFTKLDPAVVDEELGRLGSAGE